VPPVSRTMPGDIRATFVRILAYMGALAILAIAAASFFRPPPGAAAVDPAPLPQWVNVERPHPAFELLMPELAAGGTDYAILRRTADGARKDVLTWGNPAAPGPYVTVEIYRPANANESFLDAPSEIADRIVTYRITDDVKAAGMIDSKFGAFSLVDFAIVTPKTHDVRERRCLGFARPFAEPVMQIAGWFCSSAEEVVDRATLACLLDRLTIISAGGDEALAGLFARAEVKRTFCGQRSPILAATPERAKPVPIPRDLKAAHGVRLRGRLLTQR
jgi:hypothetical protein